MYLIPFNKIYRTFGSFLTILSHFHKIRQLFWFEKQLAASRCSLSTKNKGAKIQINSAETLSNFRFGRNKFKTRISAEISLHRYNFNRFLFIQFLEQIGMYLTKEKTV